jgi:hypothetical protein
MKASYSAWLLVSEPKHMPLEWSMTCEGLYMAQAAEVRF